MSDRQHPCWSPWRDGAGRCIWPDCGCPDEPPSNPTAALNQAEAIALLRAALAPFAEAAGDVDEYADDKHPIWETWPAMGITAGHLRAAAGAMERTKP